MYHEIKSAIQNDTVFYSGVIILVAVISFGLGRLSVAEGEINTAAVPDQGAIVPLKPSYIVEPGVHDASAPTASATEVAVPAGAAAATSDTTVVASKSGTKYHAPWCPGAKQIKEGNKISFPNAAAARASGYTPAANCPGLE